VQLAGVRIRKRKKDIKAKYEPEEFRDQLVAELSEVATESAEDVGKLLDSLSEKLDYKTYGETLFDVLFTGGMLGPPPRPRAPLCSGVHRLTPTRTHTHTHRRRRRVQGQCVRAVALLRVWSGREPGQRQTLRRGVQSAYSSLPVWRRARANDTAVGPRSLTAAWWWVAMVQVPADVVRRVDQEAAAFPGAVRAGRVQQAGHVCCLCDGVAARAHVGPIDAAHGPPGQGGCVHVRRGGAACALTPASHASQGCP
jgi:hypothetical protein